jgi:hypothetical protein
MPQAKQRKCPEKKNKSQAFLLVLRRDEGKTTKKNWVFTVLLANQGAMRKIIKKGY